MATINATSKLRKALWLNTFLTTQVPPQVNYDDYVHGYARCAYEEAKRQSEIDEEKMAKARRGLTSLVRVWSTELNHRSPYRDQVFSIGLLLLAYGNLDVLEDILDSVPSTSDEFLADNSLAPFYAVLIVLPLPEGLSDLQTWFKDGPSRIRDWYLKHRQHLTWNEDQGKFLLLPE